MEELGIIAFKADFTLKNPDIAAQLKEFKRAGVPMNIIYSAKDPNNPILLDANLTLEYLIQKLEQAGPSLYR